MMAGSPGERAERAGRAASPFPLTGQPVPVELDGRVFYLWWGQDRRGDDCLAISEGRLVVASTEIGIRETAASSGWATSGEQAPEVTRDDDRLEAMPIAVDEVRSWLSTAGRAVPVVAAMNVWNLAIDVAHSLERVRGDRGYWADRAYDKLFAANVPRAVGLESYRPRWTRRELSALRRIEGDAVGLLRAVLTSV